LNKPFVPYYKPEGMRNSLENYHEGKMMLARAYVVSQPYTGLFSPEVALKTGTIFPNLFEAFPEIK
jgi:hypothetical protein